MTRFLAAVCTTALLVSAPAFAQTGTGPVYGTLGFTHASTTVDRTLQTSDQEQSFDVSFGAVTGRLGTRFGRYFGAEAEGSVGVTTDEQTLAIDGATIDFSSRLRFEVAAFGVAFLPVGPDAELFARLGVGHAAADTKIDIRGVPGANFGSDDGAGFLGFGAGGQYFFDGRNGVRAEYTRWEFEDQGSHTLSLSYARRF